MLEPGKILGDRYEIIQKIGAGGMSIVYKAKCNKLQRFVAIKVLREEFVKDDAFVKKFKSEAFSAGSLSHPNIVGIYDVGQEEDLHYIVMEYVEGQTLKEYIEQNGPLAPAIALDYGVQIVSAIKHAHKKQIIHRDIKPQNILVTHDHVLKVADFGIAKAVDSSTIVSTGNAIGSVHYFSPEQAKGKYVNETSDIYSCGIVLFEMATNSLPFQADSHVSIALKHINEEIPKPSLFNPQIWPGLEYIILKATNKKQELRYQNADSMLEDMRAVLADPTVDLSHNEAGEEDINQTILLTDVQTSFIRQNEKPVSRLEPSQVPGVKMTAPQDYYEEYEEEEDEEEVSKGYKILAGVGGVLATLVIVGIIAVVAFFVIPSFSKPEYVVVPTVLGKTLEEAKVILEAKDLQVTLAGEEESSTYEAGTIMRQTPNQEEVIKPGAVINVTIAKSEEVAAEVVVPDLLGESSADAQRILDEKGLVWITEWEYSDDLERSQVIRHSPEAGITARKGDVVTLVISKGPKVVLVKVPDLYNLTVEQARLKLNNEGLKLGQRIEEASDTIEKGKVIRQSVSSNQELEEGEIVDVIISSGPNIEVPEEPVVDPNNPITPEEDPNLPVDNNPVVEEELVTITRVINAPADNVKDEYHVVVVLEDALGTRSVVDQMVKKEQFPLPIQVSGKGKGVLSTYFDGAGEYQDNINFDEVTQ